MLTSLMFITVFASDGESNTEFKIATKSLSLKDNVCVNFKVSLPDGADAKTLRLLVWEGLPADTNYTKDTAGAITLTYEGKEAGTGYYVFQYSELSAKEMGVQLYARAYYEANGETVYTKPIRYSIAEYIYNMKPKANENFSALLDSLLQYGASAQTYFGTNDILVTNGMSSVSVTDGVLNDGFTSGKYLNGTTLTITAPKKEDAILLNWKKIENGTETLLPATETLEIVVSDNVEYIPVWEIHEHTYTTEVITPTATANGTITYTCACGDSYTETIVPTDFEVTADNRHLVGYKGTEGENLVIPAVFEQDGIWYRVTSIGENAFYRCKALTNITIPSSVTNIGEYAFYTCSGLQTITIPGSVINIETGAFYNCWHMTDVIISDGVVTIGDEAFNMCDSLINVTLGKTVTSIGDFAFSHCIKLTNINIPDGVMNIGTAAFANCYDLSSITLPDSITSINYLSFSSCSKLKTVYFKGTQENWNSILIGSDNSYLENATRYYYSETQPTTSGNYWHYVDGVPTKWDEE